MIANRDGIVVDGHIYNKGQQLPDLGSLVGTNRGEKAGRTYKGLYTDKDKLPHYDDLETGSTALLVNGSELVFFFYEKTTDQWTEIL